MSSANAFQPGENSVDARRVDGRETEKAEGSSKTVEVDAKAQSYSFRYSLAYPSIGQCVIINNKNFDKRTESSLPITFSLDPLTSRIMLPVFSGMNQRKARDVDAAKVMKVFGKLGYNVKVFNDQTVDQIKHVLTSVSKEDHSNAASFVCVMLSHDNEGLFCGTDTSVELKSLTSLFRGDRCLSLVGKPKMFFIQACRETDLDGGVETDSVQDSGTTRLPVEADFLYAFSTAPGFYSWRNSMTAGSWFIQSLCDMLSKYNKELELLQIMTRVNHKVAADFESASNLPGLNAKKQIPCIVSMLTKEMHFTH